MLESHSEEKTHLIFSAISNSQKKNTEIFKFDARYPPMIYLTNCVLCILGILVLLDKSGLLIESEKIPTASQVHLFDIKGRQKSP